MPSIASLIQSLPVAHDVTISSEGYVLWLSWDGETQSVITQTLQDYGGLCVTAEDSQALWFFFSPDALLALAKLAVWGKFNPIALTVLAMPGSLCVGVGQTLSLDLEKNLIKQDVNISPSVEIWVHPHLADLGANIPGLSFAEADRHSGMARLKWTLLGADSRLPYTSSQGWYALLRPLGNPLDKGFQAGWRALFERLEKVIQTQKFKYSLSDNFLMLPLENLGQLRVWVRELLYTLSETRERGGAEYWPCVCAVVDRRGLNFNNELPHKVNVQWDSLMPDYPYVSYRNAYLLGKDFVIQDLHFSSVGATIDNWCTVNLTELHARRGSIPLLMSASLSAGNTPCFYCGVPTHEAGRCPCRHKEPVPADFWKQYSDLDLDQINAAYRTIENRLSKGGSGAYEKMLAAKGPESRVLEGLFAINVYLQPRSIDRIWSISGRDMDAEPEVDEGRNPRDEGPAWLLLEQFQQANPSELAGLDKDIAALLARTPRDWRLHCLLGFVSLERGDLPKAEKCWREAEILCMSLLHQSWHCYLQARVKEIRGRFNEAVELYERAQRLMPQWKDPSYRRLVCKVKTGFAEQVRADLVALVNAEPVRFNMILLDPEQSRGRLPVLTTLQPLWADAAKHCAAEKIQLDHLHKDINAWFPTEHEEAAALSRRVRELQERAETENYVNFLNIIAARPALEEDLAQLVQKEIEELQKKFKQYLAALEVIRDEASWFPLQKALVEFNRDFNKAAGMVNKAFASDFHNPQAFRKAQDCLEPLKELLGRLKRRLRLLCMVRDTTLFILILVRTFLWIEVAGLVLFFVAMVVVLFLGDAIGMTWMQRMLRANFWDLQKVLLTVITLTSLGIAALRTTLVFENRRDQMLEEARQQREEMQRVRLQRARAKREQVLREQRENGSGPKVSPDEE